MPSVPRLRIALLAAACGLALALPAWAHGPTVVIRGGEIEPALLEIEAGQTVHFDNQDEEPRRVRADEDAFESPVLAPGKGWHLRFPFPGSFDYALEGDPRRRGRIVVAPAKR